MHHKFDMNSIEDRAKGLARGEVTDEEVDYAREILRSRLGDIVSALYVVGLCGNKSDSVLVEDYLYGPDNNPFVEVALKALCRYLGLIGEYRGIVRMFIMNPAPDGGIRRMCAINLTKEYFLNYSDDALGCKLLSIMCADTDEDRRSARDALADILEIRHLLDDQHGLQLDYVDDDCSILIKAARDKFNCSEFQTKFRGLTH